MAVKSADVDGKAKKELGFICEKTLEDMVRDAWNFEKRNKN